MALVLADRVRETTTTTGTGTVTLAGAVTGYQSFSVIGNANTTFYAIAGQGTSEWEVGIGTYTLSGTTLARTTILSSSNAGSAVNFSAGTKDVFVTYPSNKSVNLDATGNLLLPSGTVSVPGAYFSTETSTGFYRIGANNTGFAISGTKLLDFSSALLAVTGAATVSTTLGVTGIQTNSALVDANNFRATGVAVAAAGSGAEMHYTGGSAYFIGFNRTGGVYLPVNVGGTTVDLSISGTSKLAISAAGAVTIPGTLGVTGLITGSAGQALAGYTVSPGGGTYVESGISAGNGNINVLNRTGSVFAPLILNGVMTLTNGTGASVTGTLGVTGLITSTAGNNAQVFRSASATTGYQYCEFANTGSTLRFGIDSSTGGSLFTGGGAYSANIGTTSATSFQIGTNGVVRMTLDSAGAVTIPGTLGVTGALSVGSNITLSANDTWVGVSSSNNIQFNNTTDTIKIRTSAGTDRMTFVGATTTIPGTLGVTGIQTNSALVDANNFRATGVAVAAAGSGAEMHYTGGSAYFIGFNRTGGVYLPVNVGGTTIDLSISGTSKLAISAAGAVTIPGTLGVSGAVDLAIGGATTLIGGGAWPTATIGRTNARVGVFSTTETGYILLGDVQAGVGVDRGGQLWLGARGTTATADFAYASVIGARESAVSGTLSTYLSFKTSNAAGTLAEGLRISSAGAVTIPGTLGVTGIITASSDIGLAYGKTVYWNSTSNQYVVADANGLYLGAGNLARISIAQATGVVTIPSVAATFRESLVLNGSTTAGNYVTLSNTGANLRLGIDNSAGNALITGGTAYGSVIGSNNATTLHLITNGVSRINISSAGVVAVGTTDFTTTGNGVSTAGMYCTSGVLWNFARDSNPAIEIARLTNDGALVNFYNSAGIVRGSISISGANTAYNTTSDGTLKNKIGAAPVAVSKKLIMNSPVSEFTWKDDPTEKKHIGVIAQDLYESGFHGAVNVGGMRTDEKGNEKYEPWAVDKTAFQYHLVVLAQEHESQIQSLLARIATLEAR